MLAPIWDHYPAVLVMSKASKASLEMLTQSFRASVAFEIDADAQRINLNVDPIAMGVELGIDAQRS